MSEIFKLLEQWGIENPSEQDVWDAIAEINGIDNCGDGDLAEWL